MSIKHSDLAQFDTDSSHLGQELDTIITHIQGSAWPDSTVLQTGFKHHKPQLASNQDSQNTTFTTMFTAANSFLVTPITHSSLDPAQPNSHQPHHNWLQRFNSLTGDFVGNLLDCVFSQDFQAVVKD